MQLMPYQIHNWPKSNPEIRFDTGWLIERRLNGQYSYWGGKSNRFRDSFTASHLNAIRFSREKDALFVFNCILLHVDNNPDDKEAQYYICEHLWYKD